MATIDYDPLNEEENFTSGSLNSRFEELAGATKGVNSIPVSAITPKSLQHHQVPSLVPTLDITSSPVASDHGSSRSWTVEFNTTESVYAGGSPTYRFPVKGDPGELRIDFPDGIKMGMGSGTDGVKGLLVLANVHVMTIEDTSVLNLVDYRHTVVFAIEVATNAGLTSWDMIGRTRRSLSQTLRSMDYLASSLSPFPDEWDAAAAASVYPGRQSVRFDVPLRTILSAGDASTIYGVRVTTYSTDYGSTAPWSGGDAKWSTRTANLSVIPFHAGGTIV